MRIDKFASLRQAKLSSLFAMLCAASLPCQMSLAAGMPVASPTSTHVASSTNTHVANPANMNLSSTQKTVFASNLGHFQPTVINVGGKQLNVTSSSRLTAAEAVAVGQVISVGRQSLVINALGTAIGGNMNFSVANMQQLSSLIIPQHVAVGGNFSAASKLNISGAFSNYGTFVAASDRAGYGSGSITAGLIQNFQGASISSTLAHFDLISLSNITNSGSINALGSMNLAAAGSITNALPSGAHGAAPVIFASGNLNLYTGSGIVVNSGLIQSLNNNVNISTIPLSSNLLASFATAALNVYNNGGTLRADNGNINIGDAALSSKINTNLLGGDALSQQLNIFSGNGDAEIDMKNISGVVNVNAGLTHVTASTPELKIGAMNLTGDPTFYNLDGNVIIGNTLSFPGEDLAIVASGDIITDNTAPFALDISAQNITMLAGVNFTVSGGPRDSHNAGNNNATLHILGNSALGGQIDLTNYSNVTSGGLGTMSANGTITLAAAAGAASNSGEIMLSSNGGAPSLIQAPGGVTMIAGARHNIAIAADNIATDGGAGNIQLLNYQPKYSNVTITNGTVSGIIAADSNAGLGAGGVAITGSLSLTPSVSATHGGSVIINAGGDLTFGSSSSTVINTPAGVPGGTGGDVQLIASRIVNESSAGLSIDTSNGFSDGAAGRVYIQTNKAGTSLHIGGATSASNISITAQGNDGGQVAVLSAGDLQVDPLLGLNVDPISGKGAQIYLGAGGAGAGNLSVTGAISANGLGANDGGMVVLYSNSSTVMQVNAGPTSNGIEGPISAIAGSGGQNGGTIAVINGGSSSNPGSGGIEIFNAAGLVTNTNATQNAGTINLNGVQSWASSPDGNFAPRLLGSGTVFISNSASNLDLSGLQGNANGGTFIIGGSGLFTAGGATFVANGVGSGSGGKLLINMTTDSALQVGGAATGSFSFTAQGSGTGAGGQVNIAGGSLEIDPSALILTAGAQGKGASYSFTATNSLQISSAILANGRGTGDGGSVAINSLGGDDFSLNSSSGNSFIQGTISAQPGSASGNGGQVVITTAVGGSINVGDPSNISIGLPNQTGKGGSLIIKTPTVSSFNPTSGAIAKINVNAGSFNTDGGSGGGGVIDLEAPSIIVSPASGQSVLALSAKGQGGPGGQITIASYQTALTVASGGITADASGTSGGTIRITAGRNLTVDPAAAKVTASAGDGGTLILRAGNSGSGNISITGALSAAGVSGNGGKVIIISNSASPFVVNGQSANSITGTITANGKSGGDVEVINSGSGGVSLSSSNDINVAASNGSGGIINLNDSYYENGDLIPQAQGGSGPITLGGGTLSVAAAGSGGNAGSIRLHGSDIILSSQLILDASSTTGDAGSISIMTTSGALAIGSSTRSVKIVLDSAGNAGGALSVIAGGSLTVDTGSLNLTASNAQTGARVYLQGGFSGSGGVSISGASPIDVAGSVQGGSITIIGGGGSQSPINITTSLDASSTSTTGTAGSVVIRSLGSSEISLIQDIFAVGGVKGGVITISGADDISAGKSDLFLGGALFNASGSGTTASGGSILVNVNSLILTSLFLSPFFMADAGVSASAGNGGSVTIIAQKGDLVEGTNGGQFRVSAAAGATGGNGGNITLMAMTGNLQINESLDLSGQVNGDGGKFVLFTGSTSSLQIGSASGSNFINGLSANAGNTTGSGGSITIQAPNTQNLFIADDLSPQVNNGTGGSVSILGGASTAIHFQGLSGLNANSASGNGGSISITGFSIDSDSSPFTVSANGSGGAGGSISISTGSEILVSSSTLQLLAKGDTNGGAISLVTSDSANGIVVQPFSNGVFDASGSNGTGPSYTFISSGNLSFQGTIDASGQSGSGGSIYAEVNSADSLDIGLGSSQNGFQGAASISGTAAGSFTAINHGSGGITLKSSSINTLAANGNGATLILRADDAQANAAINFTNANDTLSVAGSGADFKGGTLVLSASTLNTKGLSIIAIGTGAGGAGTVVLRQLNSVPMNLNSSTTSGASFGGINISGQGLLSASANPSTMFSDAGFAIGSGAGQPGAALVFPANGLFVYSAGDINIDVSTIHHDVFVTNSRGANIVLLANPNLASVDPSQPAAAGTGSVIREISPAPINVQGTGAADGGIIEIVNNSSNFTPLTISSFGSNPGVNGVAGLIADSGLVAGSAGAVRVNNLGADGVKILDFGNSVSVQAQATTYGGNGGSVEIVSTHGTVDIGNAIIHAESAGSEGSGGSVTIDGFVVNAHTSPFDLSVFGDGSAGSIVFRSRSTGIDQNLIGNLDVHSDNRNAGLLTVQAGNELDLLTTNLNIASGGNGNGAILDLESGQFGSLAGGILSVGNLSATGSGAGSGGSITLVINSSLPFISAQGGGNTAGFLDVSAGSLPNIVSGQNGGSISITTQGGLLVLGSPLSSFLANTAGLHGNAGSITLDATANPLVLSFDGALSASAGGVDSAGVRQYVELAIPLAPTSTQAGSITLRGSDIQAGARTGPLQLIVGGSFGGAVNIDSQSSVTMGQTSTDSMSVLANAPSTAPVYGSASAVSVNIKSAGSLIVQSGGLQLDRAATDNFAGAQITLTTSGTGVLQVLTPLEANGFGNGSAGRITILVNDSSNSFVVATSNNSLLGSGVTPNIAGYSLPTITADSVASPAGITGAPGIITIGNLSSGTGSVTIIGAVSATSSAVNNFNGLDVNGNKTDFIASGRINFLSTSGGLNVSSNVSTGNIVGTVSAVTSSDVKIALNFNGSALSVGTISTSGTATLTADSIDLRSTNVSANTQSLTISPFQNLPVKVGVVDRSPSPITSFEVSNGELDVAPSLIISNKAAGISMVGPVDFSNSLPGSISFVTTGTFTPTASIVVGTHNVSISADKLASGLSLQNIQGAANISLATTNTSTPLQISSDIIMGSGSLTISSASSIDINTNATVGSDSSTVTISNTGTGDLTTSTGGLIQANILNLSVANSGKIDVQVDAAQLTANAVNGTVNLANHFVGVLPATLNGRTDVVSLNGGFDAAFDGDMAVGNVTVLNGTLTLEITNNGNITTSGAINTPKLSILGDTNTTAEIFLSTPITTVNLRSPIEGINIHNSGSITTTGSFDANTLQGIFLQADSGNITLNGDTGGTATTQVSILAPEGSIIIVTPNTSKIHGTNLTLGAKNGFGSQLAPVSTDAKNVTLHASTSGNLYLNMTGSGALTLDDQLGRTISTLQVTANNASSLTLGTTLNNSLRSSGSTSVRTINGNIIIGDGVTVQTPSLTLISTGSGSILGDTLDTGTITTQGATLQTGLGGSIGSSSSAPLKVSAAFLSVLTKSGAAAGDVFISSASGTTVTDAFAGGKFALTVNGPTSFIGPLRSLGAMFVQADSINALSTVSSPTSIELSANSINVGTSTAIATGNLTFDVTGSSNGNIGSQTLPVILPAGLTSLIVSNVDTANAFFNSSGAVNLQTKFVGTISPSVSPVYNINAGGAVTISGNNTHIDLGNINSFGAITVNTGAMGIELHQGHTLNASGTGGNIVLVTQSLAVDLDQDSRIYAEGNVVLSAGGGQSQPATATGIVSNITFNPALGGGRTFDQNDNPINTLATNGSTSGPSGNLPNFVNVVGPTPTVFLNCDDFIGDNVIFHGNVIVTATSQPHLTNLDLSNNMFAKQVNTVTGGTLVVGATGGATGGAATIDASMVAGNVAALNIPKNVNITFNDFTVNDPLTVNLTGASTTTTKQALINGSATFGAGTQDKGTATGIINVNSNQTLTSLSVGATGKIVSGAGMNLTLNSNGDITVAGPLQANSSLFITGNNITINAPLTAGGATVQLTASVNLTVNSTVVASTGISAQAGGTLSLTKPFGGSALNLQLSGANLTQSASAAITAQDMSANFSSAITLAANISSSDILSLFTSVLSQKSGSLQAATQIVLGESGPGNFGTSTAPVKIQTPSLQLASAVDGADYFVVNSHSTPFDVFGSAKQDANVQIGSNSPSLNVASDISATNVKLYASPATANVAIDLTANVGNGNGNITLITGGTGLLISDPGKSAIGNIVNITTTNSQVGNSGHLFGVDTSSLSINNGSADGFVVNSHTSPWDLATSNVGSLTLTSAHGISLVGNLTGRRAMTITILADDFSLGSSSITTSPSSNIQISTGNGVIFENAGKNVGLTGTLQLQANAVGNQFVPIRINGSITLNSVQSAFLSTTAANTNLSTDSNTSQMLSMSSTGNITVASAISTGSLILTAGSGKIIHVDNVINAAFSAVISAGQSITGNGGVNTPFLTLKATTGSVGAAGQLFVVAANSLSFTGANAFIKDTAPTLSLTASSATGTLQILETGDLTNNGALNGKTINLTANSISVDSNIGTSTSTVTLTATGDSSTGNILPVSFNVITAASLTMSALGNIGGASFALNTATPKLTLTGSGVNIQNTGALTLGAIQANSLDIVNSTAITVSAPVSAAAIQLTAGANSKITLNAALGDANTVQIELNTGNGTVAQGAGTYLISAASSLVYTGRGAFGTTASPMRTSIGSFASLQLLSSVALNNTANSANPGISIGNLTLPTGTVSIRNNGPISLASVTAPVITASATGAAGTISLADIFASTSLSATTQTGDIDASNGSISTKTFNLNSGTGSVNVTSFTGGSLALTSTGSGNVNIAAFSSPVSLLASNLGNAILNLTSSQSVNVNGALSGGALNITSTGGGINIASSIGTASTSSIFLACGNGNITGTGVVTGNQVLLNSAGNASNGNIGSATVPLTISTPTTTAAAHIITSSTGLTNVKDTFALKTAVNAVNLDDSTAGTSFKFTGSTLLNVSNVFASNGSISLINSAAGALSIQAQGQIYANNGNVLINNTLAAGTTGGSIVFGANSNVEAFASTITPTAGNVIIAVGVAPANASGTTALASNAPNWTVNKTGSGNVFINKSPNPGFVTTGTGNVFNAFGANVSISTAKANAITLGGGVIITADPPLQAVPSNSAVRILQPASLLMTSKNDVDSSGMYINSSVNGQVNGSVNSQVNGSVNGQVNGSVNSQVNSSMNSQLNSPVNSQLNSPVNVQVSNLVNSTANSGSKSEASFIELLPSQDSAASLQLGARQLLVPATVDASSSNNLFVAPDETSQSTSSFTANPSAQARSSKQTSTLDGEELPIAYSVLSGNSAVKLPAISNPDAVSGEVASTWNNESKNLLLRPSKDTSIKIGSLHLEVGAGAIVFIMRNNDTVAVYDLHDEHRGDVILRLDGLDTILMPGTATIVTRAHGAALEALEFADVNPASDLTYRRINRVVRASSIQFVADFSLTSAFRTFEPLKQILSSKDNQDRHTLARVLKSLAAVMTVQKTQTPYVRVQPSARITSMITP